jgi:hypothetical protein
MAPGVIHLDSPVSSLVSRPVIRIHADDSDGDEAVDASWPPALSHFWDGDRAVGEPYPVEPCRSAARATRTMPFRVMNSGL